MGQIASTFGTLIGKLFRLDDDEVKIAIVSGMGAGIGSIMRLPFGGALFSIELLYGRDFVIKSLFPVMIASLTSYAVSGIYLGWLPILNIPQMTGATLGIEAISGYAAIAVIVGLCSIFYTKIIDLVRRYFEKVKVAPFIRPAIGCALVGLFAVGLPEILGTGYGWLQIAIDDNMETFTNLAHYGYNSSKDLCNCYYCRIRNRGQFFWAYLGYRGPHGSSSDFHIPYVWAVRIRRSTFRHFS